MTAPAAKPLRESMPETAAFIDACRDAFGADAINTSIRLGMQGYPDWFYAQEGGNEAGTAFNSSKQGIPLSRCVIHAPAAKKQTWWRN